VRSKIWQSIVTGAIALDIGFRWWDIKNIIKGQIIIITMAIKYTKIQTQLLYIYPEHKPSLKPIDDEYTKKSAFLMETAESGSIQRNQFLHGITPNGRAQCTGLNCSEYYRTWDYLLPNGMVTNEFALHYLRYHREEVPTEELNKLDSIPFSIGNL
jgi:hypothetical protein